MAQVTPDLELQEHVDFLLGVLLPSWQDVRRFAADWKDWSPDDRLDVLVEWGVRESRLQELRDYADQGLLTPTQCARYQELMLLIEKYRPILERLRQSVDD